MSIAALFELEQEVRRLAIAGSELAVGDFRLKKLLPPIQKSGESVPVFARIGAQLEKLIEPGEENPAEILLELATLIYAILYTQGATGVEGELTPLEVTPLELTTPITYRRLKPVYEALTSKASGRTEVLRQAYEDGVLKDLRLVDPCIAALDEGYPEIAELAMKAVREVGPAVVPVLLQALDYTGGKGHARRLQLVAELSGLANREIYYTALDKGSKDVMIAAIDALKDDPEAEQVLLQFAKDRKQDVREAAYFALADHSTPAAVDCLFKAFMGKDRLIALTPISSSTSDAVGERLLVEAEKAFADLHKFVAEVEPAKFGIVSVVGAEGPVRETVDWLTFLLVAMENKWTESVFKFLEKCLESVELLSRLPVKTIGGHPGMVNLATKVASLVTSFKTPEAFALIERQRGVANNALIGYVFEVSLRTEAPKRVYERFAGFVQKGRKSFEGQQILQWIEELVHYKEAVGCQTYQAVQYIQSLAYRRGHTYNLRTAHMEDGSEIRLDARWVKILMELDELELVCRFVVEGDWEYMHYLVKRLDRARKENGPVLQIITSLHRAGYPDTVKLALGIVEESAASIGNYNWYYWVVPFLRTLPASEADKVEELIDKFDGWQRSTLESVVAQIRRNTI